MEKACSMLRNDDKVRKERVSIYSMSLFEIVEKTSQITLLIITLYAEIPSKNLSTRIKRSSGECTANFKRRRRRRPTARAIPVVVIDAQWDIRRRRAPITIFEIRSSSSKI